MLNISTVMGRLTAEPNLKTTQSGTSIVNFTLACDRDYSDDTDFVDCVAWRQTAEFISKYFHKGMLVAVTGRLQSRLYKDKNGENRKTTEVNVDYSYFAESKKPETKPDVKQTFDELDDDGEIPF